MKKSLLLGLLIVAILSLTGCLGGPEVSQADLPDWYLSPPVAQDALFGVGEATAGNRQLALNAAAANARAQIAASIDAQIQSAMNIYLQEAGVDDNTQTISFMESVTRQLVDTKLQGTRTEQQAFSKDGRTAFVLVSYGVSQFKNDFEDVVNQFQRNEDAAFAEFKADQAFQALDHALENRQDD